MEEEGIKNKEESSKSIRNVIIVFGIVLLLIVAIVLISYFKGFGKGYFIYDGKGGKYRIDLVKFGNMTDYYVHTEANGKQYVYPFRNDPRNLKSIYLEPDVKNKFINKVEVYVTQDADKLGTNSLIGKMEFIKILSKYNEEGIYGLEVVNTFTTKFEERPAITCNNVTKNIGVIYLKLGDENKIYSDKDCVIIQGINDDNLLLASEKFAYHLLNLF